MERVGNVKRIQTFGAVVFVACGLGFLPMIGCVASSEQDADDADVALAPEATGPRVERRCGKDGQRCCMHACCHDGSDCVYILRTRSKMCMQKPPHGSRIVTGDCGGL